VLVVENNEVKSEILIEIPKFQLSNQISALGDTGTNEGSSAIADDSSITAGDPSVVGSSVHVGAGNARSNLIMRSIVPFSKGFICVFDSAMSVYEKSDEVKEGYKFVKEYILTNEGLFRMCVMCSPNEENILCGLSNNQLFAMPFGTVEILKVCINFTQKCFDFIEKKTDGRFEV
jgi:hypothetical protein